LSDIFTVDSSVLNVPVWRLELLHYIWGISGLKIHQT